MKNLRYLQQTQKARIESDLVLTRIGELSLRDINTLARGLLYTAVGVDAVIIEGLISTPGSGLSVDVSVPAVALQAISDGTLTTDVKYGIDENVGIPYNLVLDAADLSLNRIDIIEAQIQQRSAWEDDDVAIVDPATKIVSPDTRDRDFELYAVLQKKTGTPGASPVPPSPTTATAGFILGTVDINSSTNDLSAKYILKLAEGLGTDFAEIDLRGATPSATTAAEILTAINTAGFGTIATLSGNFLLITATGTGENSIIGIKQPLDASKDAYAQVLGGIEISGYYDIFKGDNGFFKVTEIFIPIAATTLTAGNVRSREEKDTDWDADAGTIVNGVSLDAHRTQARLDHPDQSIFIEHLDPSLLTLITEKLTNYRGPYATVYAVPGDTTFTQAGLYTRNIALKKENGDVEDNIWDVEQEFPVNRVDQREEDFSSGSGYSVPVSISELAADRREFVVADPVDDGTNKYEAQYFAGNFSRIGIYITNGGSVASFTHLRVTLHTVGNSPLDTADIPIADLQSVGTGWIYADMSAALTETVTYHFHFEMIGESSPTPPVIGNASGTGADTAAFREMYLASAGKYGGANEADVLKLLDSAGSRLVTVRASGADDIVTPGDGFLGEGSGTNYDFVVTDFSNTTFWENWKYEDFVGIDPDLGRLKISSTNIDILRIFAEYNVTEGLDDLDAKSFFRQSKDQPIDDNLIILDRETEGVVERAGITFEPTDRQGQLSDAIEIIRKPAQTIIAGRVNASGIPVFLTESAGIIGIDTNSGGAPFIAACADGYNILKVDNRATRIIFNSDQASLWNLSAEGNDDYYLFLDIDADNAITAIFSTYSPIYGYAFPGTPGTGQFFYQLPSNQAFVWSGSAWEQKVRVFVGYVNKAPAYTVYPEPVTPGNNRIFGELLMYGDNTLNLNVGGTTASTLSAGMNFIGDSGAVVGGVNAGSADTSLLTLKSPTGNILTIDCNADKELDISGNLTVEADSAINQDLTTDADVLFRKIAVQYLSLNTLVGVNAGSSMVSGAFANTCVGYEAGEAITDSSSNSCFGREAGNNITSGSGNTCVGQGSSNVTTGDYNICIGSDCGASISTASNVIALGANFPGANVSDTTYIDNITGVTTGLTAIPVLVDANGQLGVNSSSIRYKENLRDSIIDSAKIYDLHLYNFNYKSPKVESIGYTAEDMKNIFPEFVVEITKEKAFSTKEIAYNEADKDEKIPDAIQYQNLIFPVIEEMKKLLFEITTLKDRIAVLEG